MKNLSIAMPALPFAAATLAAILATTPAQAGRDPFARPALPRPAAADPAAAAAAGVAAEPAARPQLRAVMVASGRALANISGRIVAAGEWVGDYKVVKIRERSVTLATRGGTKSELTLDQADNK
jgi:hypothetical protein